MNLTRLLAELALIIQDDELEAYSTQWLNDAVLELAADFELPILKLKTPTTVNIRAFSAWVTGTVYAVDDLATNSGSYYKCLTAHTAGTFATDLSAAKWEAVTVDAAWLRDMPSTYQKKCFKCRNESDDDIAINRFISTIDDLDPDHDDTGDSVMDVAIEAGQIATYPLVSDTLKLWFYRKPVDMSAGTDEPDGIPTEFHERVIIPKVIIKNFRMLRDMVLDGPHNSIAYWQMKLKEGLYGSQNGDIGMVNYLAKLKGIRRHGGRDPLP